MASTSVIRRLEGKVALITGAASGIGAATARLFSRHGAKVVIADVQDELARQVCKELGPPSSAISVHCDVTKEADVAAAVDAAVSAYGKLDVMYNNAGILGVPQIKILDCQPSEFRRVVDINLTGAFIGTKHAARVMIPRRSGSIITTASVCSAVGGASTYAYTASKHGVVGLARTAAVELGRHGVRVNCVSPHLTPTPLLRDFVGMDDEGIWSCYTNLKGVKLTPEDVAEAALYLAADESKYVSGHNLMVDGGFTVMNGGLSIFEMFH